MDRTRKKPQRSFNSMSQVALAMGLTPAITTGQKRKALTDAKLDSDSRQKQVTRRERLPPCLRRTDKTESPQNSSRGQSAELNAQKKLCKEGSGSRQGHTGGKRKDPTYRAEHNDPNQMATDLNTDSCSAKTKARPKEQMAIAVRGLPALRIPSMSKRKPGRPTYGIFEWPGNAYWRLGRADEYSFVAVLEGEHPGIKQPTAFAAANEADHQAGDIPDNVGSAKKANVSQPHKQPAAPQQQTPNLGDGSKAISHNGSATAGLKASHADKHRGPTLHGNNSLAPRRANAAVNSRSAEQQPGTAAPYVNSQMEQQYFAQVAVAGMQASPADLESELDNGSRILTTCPQPHAANVSPLGQADDGVDMLASGSELVAAAVKVETLLRRYSAERNAVQAKMKEQDKQISLLCQHNVQLQQNKEKLQDTLRYIIEVLQEAAAAQANAGV